MILQLAQPGKLPDTALPTIQNSVNVADFCWDPFDPHKLIVGRRSGSQYIFKVKCILGSENKR